MSLYSVDPQGPGSYDGGLQSLTELQRCSSAALPTLIFCTLLLVTELLPSLPFYFGLVHSMALGTTIAAATCGLVLIAQWAIRSRSVGKRLWDANANGIVLAVTVVILIILHGVIADQIQPLNSVRFVASLIPLVLLLAGGLALAGAIRAASASQITTATWVSFCAMCAILLLKVTGLQPLSDHWPKSTFPFTETSHFALAFSPIFLFRCSSAHSSRRNLWVLFGFALAILLKSATLLAVACIGALICRRFLVVLLAAVLVLAGGLTVNMKYFTHRADISSNSSNLSALVYVEGWEMLAQSLERTDGWGVGFQQLGVRGSNVPAAQAIRRLTGGEDLNLEDGGFVFAKLGAELGGLGVLLTVGYVLLSSKCLHALRSRSRLISPNKMLAQAIVVAYGVDMFARGAGYFCESTLLFVAAILTLAPVGGVLRSGYGPNSDRLVVVR